MKNLGKVFALVLAFSIVASPAYACYSTYFNEIFTKATKADLDKGQLVALKSLKSQFMNSDHKKGLCDRAHNRHETEFATAAAGFLNDSQFKTIIGKQKTEVQKLRYEVNQLKSELAEIKALLKQLQK